MVSRMTGALVRALLVMVMIATPSTLLPGNGVDTAQIVALVALFGGALTFVEYFSTYPGLVEFRYAPPFNRIRYLSLFLTVFLLTIIARGNFDPTPMTMFVQAIGQIIGHAIDFPYSPVRLMTLMLSSTASPDHVNEVRTAAGMAYLISLVMLSIFVIILKIFGWPSSNGTFNVWVNLPTFDPTIGGDVVARLQRDARFNLALGFLLPFLVPVVVKAASSSFGEITLTTPQTLIWMVAAWAFLPASLFMRGIAMMRVADMIREKRRRNDALHAHMQPA